MDLVTTTGIKGKVFSPRRPNSYWMQSFCVIMLMLISGHSNLLSLLKILKSRQSQKMTRTLVGLFWRLIQPAGSASLIIHLQTNLTTFFLSNTISSVTSSSSLSPRFTTSAGSSLSTCMKESLKIAEKYYCSEQRILVGLFWRLIQPAGSASLIIHLQTNLTTFFLSNTISSVTSSSSLSPRFTTSAGSSLSTCMKESLKIAEKYYCSEQRKYIIARKALGWASLSKVSQKSLKSLL